MKDLNGREINYLRLSVTDRCNLRCVYCMPESGVPLIDHADILSVEEVVRAVWIINDTVGLSKVRITGGEPLVRRGVLQIIKGISSIGIEELTLTTNGLLLRQMAKQLAEAGISRVNISLDSLRDRRLKKITRRDTSLRDIEKAIRSAFDAGLKPVRINCVLMRNINDDEILEFLEWGSRMGVTIRFIEHMPSSLNQDIFVSRDEIIERVSLSGTVRRQKDDGSTAGIYTVGDCADIFGIIAPFSDPMCKYCNRIRLSARGMLVPCLASAEEVSIREPLRTGADDEGISKLVQQMVFNKPESHGGCVSADMWKIGG